MKQGQIKSRRHMQFLILGKVVPYSGKRSQGRKILRMVGKEKIAEKTIVDR